MSGFRRHGSKDRCHQHASGKNDPPGDISLCSAGDEHLSMAGCRPASRNINEESPSVAVLEALAKAQQPAGLLSRRYYDLAYVLIVLLAFPLYWVKVIDWRLCSEDHPEERDPWLIKPPSPAWVENWPCNGGQLSKLGYTIASPAPFLRSLFWPFSYSELHFFTSFYTVFVGGLLMLAATSGNKYDVSNPWRLSWAFVSRLQVRAAPILVKVLRPQTPWPVAISQSLPLEGPASVLYSVALMGPWRHQALGAVMDILHVVVICKLYDKSWPHRVSPRFVVLLHAVCGLLTVVISALIPPFLSKSSAAEGPADEVSEVAAARCRQREWSAGTTWGSARRGKVDEKVRGRGPPNPCYEVWQSKSGKGIVSKAAALASAAAPKDASAAYARDIASSAGAAVPRASQAEYVDSDQVRERQLLCLCRRLVIGRATADNTTTQAQQTSRSSTGDGDALGADNDISSKHYDREHEIYGHALAWTHLQMKLPRLEPSELSSAALGPIGVRSRLGEAVVAAYPDVTCTEVAVRSGCVEVHLDLVRGVPATSAASSRSATMEVIGSVVGQHPPRQSETGIGLLSGSHLAPASVEQQGLASCILKALGLPHGYDSAVRAQVGAHLLTLTPAADTSGCWAVLGTRRMQAHEVPWVTSAEPPAVVAPVPQAVPVASAGVATGGSNNSSSGGNSGSGFVATLHLTISGSAERLEVAHADADLELLALFEGAFLELSNLRWGALEDSPYAAASNGSAAAAGVTAAPRIVRLPPTLALSRRCLTVDLTLPVGRTGAVTLLLMRRGTTGQSHSLLLLKPEDAPIAEEVMALRKRVSTVAWGATAVDGGGCPPASSVASFVRDLGHWLQYRDFWRRKAVACLLAPGAGGANAAVARSSRHAGRLAASWMRALLAWNRQIGDGGSSGLRVQVKPQRDECDTGQQLGAASGHGGTAVVHTHAHAHVHDVQLGDLGLPDQGRSGGNGSEDCVARQTRGRGSSMQPPGRSDPLIPRAGRHAPPAHVINGAAPSALLEEQQRLAQGSLPAFEQQTYQNHMRTARRVLLEFALEQQCAAIAEALLEPAPVPSLPVTAAAAVYGSTSYLAELAESSRSSSPDGLTLLHRAVRSGDAATVEVILRAAVRMADAAASVAAAAAATTMLSSGDGPSPLKSPPPPQALVRGSDDVTSDQRRLNLYDWDTPDIYGITPLHYLAVLGDGGALARHVLGSHAEALALWSVGRSDMPSPATFASQNGLAIDTNALREGRDEGAGSAGCSALGPKAQKGAAWPLPLAALLGFTCSEVERHYQRFNLVWRQGGMMPTSLVLLFLHFVACAAGLMQARAQQHAYCRLGLLPLVVLQGGSFLLAICGVRPTIGITRRKLCCAAAWALQSVAVGVLLYC